MVIPAGALQRTVPLKGLDAELSIYFPAEMDSLATWQADCCTGGSPAYGFWDRRYQIMQTRYGLCFSKFIPDSIRQVTVFHQDYPLQDTTVVSVTELDEGIRIINEKEWISYNRTLPILFKGVEQWDGLGASYFAFNGFTINTPTKRTQLPHETLDVCSNFRGNPVRICFECVGSDCAGFAARMLPYARTLQFKSTSPSPEK